MDRKMRGVALIVFGILFYLVSQELQGYLWLWHIGISIPWGLISLGLGVAGLVYTFKKK